MLAGMCNISDRVFSTLEFSGPETLIPKVKQEFRRGYTTQSFKKSFKSMIYECGLNAKVSGQKLSI